MIPRYALPEMAELFTDEARLATWLEVELLAVEAWAKLGVIPPADAEAIRGRASVTPAAVEERERHGRRRRRLRRRGAGVRRLPGRCVGAPRTDVERCRRHGVVGHLVRACDLLRTVDDLERRRGTASSVTRRWPGARTVSTGADDVRVEARAVGAPATPRPRPASGGPRHHCSRKAVRRRRYVFERGSRGGGVRL